MDCKDFSPSILKEINPEYSLDGLMLKLKLQYFGKNLGERLVLCYFEALLFCASINDGLINKWDSHMALVVKICLPMQEMQETWVPSLGWEDPLE